MDSLNNALVVYYFYDEQRKSLSGKESLSVSMGCDSFFLPTPSNSRPWDIALKVNEMEYAYNGRNFWKVIAKNIDTVRVALFEQAFRDGEYDNNPFSWEKIKDQILHNQPNCCGDFLESSFPLLRDKDAKSEHDEEPDIYRLNLDPERIISSNEEIVVSQINLMASCYAVLDGALWQISGEPCYVFTDEGFIVSDKVDKSSYSPSCVFSANQREAVEAKARELGLSLSIPDIHVLMPWAVSNSPKLQSCVPDFIAQEFLD